MWPIFLQEIIFKDFLFRLVEVGVFDKPKDGGKYDIGQVRLTEYL
jgi:hypothetical protein